MPAKVTVQANLGQFIEINCRFCRLNLDAVVSAVDQTGHVVKVQCRTCRHFQDYRSPSDLAEKRKKQIDKAMKIAELHTRGPVRQNATPAMVPLSQEEVARKAWLEETENSNPLKAKIYDRTREYFEGDFLIHKVHGLGKVREVRSDDTILVLFRLGYKSLEHDRPAEE